MSRQHRKITNNTVALASTDLNGDSDVGDFMMVTDLKSSTS